MIYAVFNVLILIAFSTSWTECNETIVDPTYPVCKRATGAKASIAFAMFTWLALCVSMMFTWKEWRDQNYEGLPIFGDFSSFMPGGGGGGMGGGGRIRAPVRREHADVRVTGGGRRGEEAAGRARVRTRDESRGLPRALLLCAR